MCPKCESLKLSDVTDMDDKHTMLFCGNCSYQSGAIEFLPPDEPEPEANERKPSLLERFVSKFR